ncbi:hypothetical protein B0H13DRAFT_2313937 [Mycena leptocephala]|nr:hypothetical protein B0H13DRAFT_2313937 [Mycena leptocephala]
MPVTRSVKAKNRKKAAAEVARLTPTPPPAPAAAKEPTPFGLGGARRLFLLDWLPAFLAVEGIRPLTPFWKSVLTDYWATFSWRRSIDEDPPSEPDPLLDDPLAELSRTDQFKKDEVIKQTERRIRAWFYYQQMQTLRPAQVSRKRAGSPEV